ncbi:hypothetical protein JKP88DRAFT_348564 [Tribonema minus]|uniref:Uncharacterized protein n=1 Tax=Tribonema minus TaxID=303371 RepID=A0A835YXT0_9STRA|nr:hypothetical protein JKP88DRAFT_348564 [Tribonema minus]
MSHADAAVVQVAYHHGQYLFPGFAGDTFTKTFRINGLRSIKATSGQMTAYGIICEVINQHGRVCFVAEKTLLFPWKIPPSEATAEPQPPRQQTLKEHFINQSEKLLALGGTSLSRLRAGQLSMALSSLGRLNHDRHYNTVKYSGDELMIPGGLVYALSTAATARDLHEILHEELVNCNFINPLRPGDVMGCISYISAAETHVNGVLERLTVKTIGIKGMDVRDLKGQPLPLALFTTPKLRTKRVEEICAKECPELSKRIVVISERTIMRQAPKTDMFLL